MNSQVTALDEVEDLRQQRIEQLAADLGPDWANQHRPGTAGCHELLDRTALLADNLEHFVVENPACVQNKEWHAIARRAADALHELYQRIGAEHLHLDH
jgi:hypothetical protein